MSYEFSALYKCRLCREIIDTGIRVQSKNDAILNVQNVFKYAQFKTNPYLSDSALDLTAIHNCADESVGIADFQGFKIK